MCIKVLGYSSMNYLSLVFVVFFYCNKLDVIKLFLCMFFEIMIIFFFLVDCLKFFV